VIDRLLRAQNDHDLEAFAACFAEDYRSEQPVHPGRAFLGREQARRNWAKVFGSVPDFHAELLRSVVDGETVWSEWHWSGTTEGGGRLEMRGVTLFGVREGRLAWGRLYMEPVEDDGGIDENVERMKEGFRSER
jgi:hypothetical protein